MRKCLVTSRGHRKYSGKGVFNGVSKKFMRRNDVHCLVRGRTDRWQEWKQVSTL